MSKFYQIDKANTTDIWLTPPSLINALGAFDLDPCCPDNLPWETAKEYFSLERGQDGLALPWKGRVWLNPPYSNWGDFMKKLKEHNNGIALIFARTETKNFFTHVWNGADSILFLKGRVKFITKDLQTKSASTAPSVLIAYGENNTAALALSGLEGRLVKLKI